MAITKTEIDDTTLVELYVGQSIGADKVAAVLGVSASRIRSRLRKIGILRSSGPPPGTMSGERNPWWRGGKRKKQGYVVVRVATNKCEYEHRLVAEEKLGRALLTGEVVHHINGDKGDNRPENIEVFSSHSDHMKLHMSSEEGRRRAVKSPRGEEAHQAKLAVGDVSAIRDAVASGVPHRKVAKQFGISKSQVTRIASKRSWSHVA